MSADSKKALQPIIVKKVKKAAHGHHGGAWKIAYADFVTAMMAFFLLMWLLGSTTKGELQGIASYFSAPLKIALPGGDGAGNANTILPGGGQDLSRTAGQVRAGEVQRAGNQAETEAEQALRDRDRITGLHAKISALMSSNPKLAELRSQVRLDVTPDGLRIQIVDDLNRPMFDMGSTLVKSYMREVLQSIGATLEGVENRVSLEGHTDAKPYGSGERGYSNWELSTDRANASRRELVAGGMPESKVLRVVGLASSQLLEPQDPSAPVNRRISIIVLTKAAETRMLTSPKVVEVPAAAAAVSQSLSGLSATRP